MTLPFDKIDRLGDDVRTRVTARAPSSQSPEARPSQGYELSSPAISAALSGVVTPPVLRARCLAPISAADLFSRVPAGTRHSQAQSFRPSDRRRLSRVSNRVGTRLSSRIHLLRRQKTIAGRPALGSQAVGAASASCYRITTPHAMNGVPSKRPCERCQPATTWVTRIADAPCRIPPTCSASRARQRVPGPASPRSTKSAVPQTRGAFHQQVPPSLSDSRRPATAWAATGALGSSPRTQLPTCVHDPTLGDARPSCLPAINRGRWATCFLSASATERSPSTPPYRPNSGETVASHFLTEWRRPFRAAANRASSGQGSLGLLSRVDPHHSDRSPQWIYPNLIDSGTPCHEIVPNGAWKS